MVPSLSLDLESDVVLRDGTTVRLRPSRQDDTATALRFLEGLSAESLYNRFLMTPRLDLARARACVDVDQAREVVDDRDRGYFGRGNQESDQVGYIDAQTRAIFGRSYAAEPDVLVRELAGDTAIQAADTLLLTVPNQLGVEYNAHAIESILKYVAPELGWR